jgi:hypothetical protein
MSTVHHVRMGITASVFWIGFLAGGDMAKAGFLFGEPTKVPNVNSDVDDIEPQISRDGLELYFVSDRRDRSGDFSDNIWVSRRCSVRSPWSTPVKLDAPINTAGKETSPSISADGLELYFSSGYADLWVSTREGKDTPWGPPVKLPSPVNSVYSEDCPCLSADGLSLYFISDRPVGTASPPYSDTFVATRPSRDAPWGEPVRLGPNVNSDQFEYTPFISPDGLSLFFARGFYKFHIYVCRRNATTDPWGPAAFFHPVNSGTATASNGPGLAEANLSFSADDSMLYFERGTEMSSGDFDIWQVEVKPIVDFNSDGRVDNLDLLIMVADWGVVGQRYGPLTARCDIAPFPFGDGVVDAKDLLVLAEHMNRDP